MQTARLFVVASLLGIGGCAVPPRDNPYDGVQAPVAHLQVVDATDPDTGGCAVPSDGPFPSVLGASRGRCLALDAIATLDPDGSRPSFSYEVDVPGETAPREIEGNGDFEFLDEDLRLSLPPFETLVFRVHVIDAAVPTLVDSSEAPFILQNTAPIASTWPTRSFPAGGFGWNRGEPLAVRLPTMGSGDADGDVPVLEYCWSGNGAETCLAPGAPDHVVPVPASDGTNVWRLQLREPDAVSNDDLAVLRVRAPDPWLQPTPGSFYATRLDGSRFLLDPLRYPVDIEALGSAAGTAGMVTFESDGAGRTLMFRRLREGAQTAVVNVTPSYDQLAVDSSRRRVWASESSPRILDHYTVNPAGTGITFGSTVDIDAAAGNGPLEIMGLDSSGSVWVSQFLDTVEIWKYDPDGGTRMLDPEPARQRGFGARPGSNEVWTMLDPSVLTELCRLVRWDASGTRTDIPLPTVDAWGPFWADAQRFWIFSESHGLLLVDAEQLLAGVPLADAAVLEFPSFWSPDAYAFVDPGTGQLYWSGVGLLEPVLIRKDGTVTPSGIPFESPFVGAFDPVGIPWMWRPFAGLIQRSQSGSTNGAVATAVVSVSGLQHASLDPETGGVWVLTAPPRSLRRFSEDGARLAEYTEIQVGGTMQPFPALDPLRVSPDGSTAFGFASAGLYAIDLARLRSPDGSDQMTLVLGSAAIAAIDPMPGVLEPLAPESGEMPGAWLVGNDGRAHIARVGSPAAELVFTGAAPAHAAARSLVSNRLCVAARAVGNPSNLAVHWVATDGTQTLLADFFIPGTTTLATTFDATRDVCWMALREADSTTTRMVSWNEAGTELRDSTINYQLAPFSSVATHPDTLWIAGVNQFGEARVTEIRFPTVFGGISQTEYPYASQYFIRP